MKNQMVLGGLVRLQGRDMLPRMGVPMLARLRFLQPDRIAKAYLANPMLIKQIYHEEMQRDKY